MSWTEAASPQPPDLARCIRNTNGHIADVAFGADGTLYYAFAGYKTAGDFHSSIYVGRSVDFGHTFQTTEIPGLEPPYPTDSLGTPALPTLTLDPTNPRRLYVAFQENYGCSPWPTVPSPPASSSATTRYEQR